MKWTCFLSGSGSTGKSHLVKAISNALSKLLLYHCKDPEEPIVLSLGPTGMLAVKIGGTTINSGVNFGTNLLGVNGKSKAALRNKLSEVDFFNYRWTFYHIKWLMDRYWFKVRRNS